MGSKGLRRLREQLIDQVGEHRRGRHVAEGIGQARADVDREDARCPEASCDANRFIRRETAVHEQLPITVNGGEDHRNRDTRAHGLGEIAIAEHHGGSPSHVRRHGAEAPWQTVEITARGQVRTEQQLVEQRVDLRLARDRTL